MKAGTWGQGEGQNDAAVRKDGSPAPWSGWAPPRVRGLGSLCPS